jgi:hypothetical protein
MLKHESQNVVEVPIRARPVKANLLVKSHVLEPKWTILNVVLKAVLTYLNCFLDLAFSLFIL